MAAVSNDPGLRAGSVCLSLLAEKGRVHLTDQNLKSPLALLFSDERIASWSAEERSLVDRVRPVFNLSPCDLLARGVFKDFACVESQISGTSAERTLQEAFIHRLFLTALADPDSSSLPIWHQVSHHLPITADEWEKCPKELKQFYATLPLLKDLRVGDVLPGLPKEREELTTDQVLEAWKLWVLHFKGLWRLQSVLYTNLVGLAAETFASKHKNAHSKDLSVFRKFKKQDLQRIFWETPMTFLLKYEAVAIFEKRLPFMEKQIGLFKGDPHLLQALIFDHLKSIMHMVKEITDLAEEMEKTMQKHLKSGERRIFPDKRLEMEGNQTVVRVAHQESIDNWHAVALKGSILTLFSNHLLAIIQKNLAPVLAESKDHHKLSDQLQRSLQAQIAYRSLVLEDTEFEEASPPKKVEEKKEEEVEEAPPVLPIAAPSQTRVAPATDPLQAQMEEDLMHMSQADPIGSLSPYAATVAEVLERKTRQPEMGDHLFLMIQGVELLAACKDRECQSAILRSIVIDGHIAMEQALSERAGVPNSENHNLADLSQMSPLSEDQRQFLQECPLALYWARYPACSSRYFGNAKNHPPLLRLLLRPTPEDCSALVSFVRHVCRLVIPPEVLSEKWLAQVERLAGQATSHPTEATSPPFRDLVQAIKKATLPHSKKEDPELEEALLHLEELIHYLSWIEQGKKLQRAHPHPSLQFWHQRNELDVDKLFKHLYATDCILHHYGDPRRHAISSLFETLDEIRTLDFVTKQFLKSFNLGIAHHYHRRPSPMKGYAELLASCRLQVHEFRKAKKGQVWGSFDKAMQLFTAQLPFTLQTLSR